MLPFNTSRSLCVGRGSEPFWQYDIFIFIEGDLAVKSYYITNRSIAFLALLKLWNVWLPLTTSSFAIAGKDTEREMKIERGK